MAGRRWTRVERRLLREAYAARGQHDGWLHDLAKRLDRSWRACTDMASRSGYSGGYRPWAARDIALLRAYYHGPRTHGSQERLARRLGRPARNLIRKARSLGLVS